MQASDAMAAPVAAEGAMDTTDDGYTLGEIAQLIDNIKVLEVEVRISTRSHVNDTRGHRAEALGVWYGWKDKNIMASATVWLQPCKKSHNAERKYSTAQQGGGKCECG